MVIGYCTMMFLWSFTLSLQVVIHAKISHGYSRYGTPWLLKPRFSMVTHAKIAHGFSTVTHTQIANGFSIVNSTKAAHGFSIVILRLPMAFP